MERLSIDLYNRLINEGYEYLSVLNIEKLTQEGITRIILAPLKTVEALIGHVVTGIHDAVIERIVLNNDDCFELYVSV